MDYNLETFTICGEILKNKTEYILKCNDCDEDFILLEDFIIHHIDLHTPQDKNVENPGEDNEEDYLDGSEFVYCEKDNSLLELNNEDSIATSHKTNEQQYSEDLFEEIEESTCVEEEKDQLLETRSIIDVADSIPDDREDENTDDLEFVEEEDPLEEPMVGDADDDKADDEYDDGDDNSSQNYEPDDNAENSDSDVEFEATVDRKSRQFVNNFLKIERNFIAFVAAYKNQPRLWNLEAYPKFKSKTERDSFLQKVANEIKSHLNIHMTCDNVSDVIERIRHDYKAELKCSRPHESNERNGAPSSTTSRLSFLDPFLDNNSMVKLDTQRGNLKKDQILDILRIYKRFPSLWDTSLMEYVCTNKRTEALKEMTEAVRTEVGLNLDEDALKNYLLGVHNHFFKEKQNHMSKKGSTKSIYFPHMSFLHDHVGPFCCSKCGRKQRNPLQFKLHKYHNHGASPLKCPECKKEYEKLEPYIAHIRRHMNDMSDKCKLCGKMFIRAADLRIHMRSHTGAKPYICEICGSSFTMPNSLKLHRMRHENIKNVFCEICSKGFSTSTRLAAHMVTHSDERNFACKTCGKAYKSKKTLQAHIHTHEEGRNYPCPQCGKMYKNRIGVLQHLRTHRSTGVTKSNPFIKQ